MRSTALQTLDFCFRLIVPTFVAAWLFFSDKALLLADDRPNIIFLMSDDQCVNSLGCYGASGVKTPNIDQLAKEGTRFDRHYANTAICRASRATVMTGLYEFRHGCNFERGPLSSTLWDSSYSMLLRQAGYTTAFAGKFGFTVSETPNAQGNLPEDDFDRWGGGPGQTSYETSKNESMKAYADRYPHSTLAYAAFARDFIRDCSRAANPFCLSISFKAPHRPVSPDRQFDGVYQDAEFPKPANFGREHGTHFAPQSRLGRQFPRFYQWEYATAYDRVMAKYHQQIFAIDVAVGQIREALEKFGCDGNTIIIFTSDNGFLCGAHGYGSKVLPYEEASRVPCIIYDPRIEVPVSDCSKVTGHIDIAPTILDIAETRDPSERDGVSMRGLLRNRDLRIHEHVILMNAWGPRPVFSLGLVTDRHKYIYWPYNQQMLTPTEELYDLLADPLELENLAGTDHKELPRLRTRYRQVVDFWRSTSVETDGYKELAEFFAN